MELFKKTDLNNDKDQHIEVSTMEKVHDASSPTSLNDAETATAIDAQRAAEAKLVRRIDILILPLLALSIMVGYLDRSNIGNAVSFSQSSATQTLRRRLTPMRDTCRSYADEP